MSLKFPKSPSPEAEQFCNKWDSLNHERKIRLCESYGATYAGGKEYRTRVSNDYPYKKNYQKEVEEDPMPIINLPKIKIREYQARVRTGTEEQQAVIISDWHADKITKSYNKEIYKKRVHNLFDKIILIKELHEHMYPINVINLFYLGDNVQGENTHQGSKVGDISMGARDQVVRLALPTNLEFIYSLRQHYSEIHLYCWAGNHGMISKETPQTSNWDLLLYDLLKSTIVDPNITVDISEDFGSVVEVFGHRFFGFHGDGTNSIQGVPLIALSKKIKSWHMQFGGFEIAMCGHFHKTQYDEIARGAELFMNGTLVSDDDWALKRLGISSTPTQWTFGIHPDRAVSWQYPLNVE